MRSVALVLSAFFALAALAQATAVASAQQPNTEGNPPVYTPQRFVSRPDLRPPKIVVTKRSGRTAPGYILVSVRVPAQGTPDQYGPMITDDRGELVWFNPRRDVFTSNLHAIKYMGRDALTWWEGKLFPGYGRGDWVVVDSAYRQIARIKGGNGLQTDFHAIYFTDTTVIVENYVTVSRDLTAVGGAPNTNVLDSVVQEIDLRTGKVLFQWSALDHIGFSESSRKPPTRPGEPYEFLHLNSIDIEKDGNFLFGARRTNSLFEVDRKTGAILWRLGGTCSNFELRPSTSSIDRRLAGRCSSFEMDPGTEFIAQHDAQRNTDGSISLFDNGQKSKGYRQSRGIVLNVDEIKRRVTLRHAYPNPIEKVSRTQGSFQPLSDGHFLAGWGDLPNFSEFDGDGRLIYNAQLPQGVNSYRVYRQAWRGLPDERPAIAVREAAPAGVQVYASWNGATNVAGWQVLSGSSRDDLRAAGSKAKSGFETEIDVPSGQKYFQVKAKSDAGETLGSSKVVRP